MKPHFKPIPTVFTRHGLVMELVSSKKKGGLKFAIYSVERDNEYLGAELHIVRKNKEDNFIGGKKVWIKGNEYLASTSEFGSFGWYFPFNKTNFPEKEAEAAINKVLLHEEVIDEKLIECGVRLDG